MKRLKALSFQISVRTVLRNQSLVAEDEVIGPFPVAANAANDKVRNECVSGCSADCGHGQQLKLIQPNPNLQK